MKTNMAEEKIAGSKWNNVTVLKILKGLAPKSKAESYSFAGIDDQALWQVFIIIGKL